MRQSPILQNSTDIITFNMFTKSNFKKVLRLLGYILLSFLLIYVVVFFFGSKLLSSGDPILYELTAAIFMGIIFWACNEVTSALEERIKILEKRIDDLENKE